MTIHRRLIIIGISVAAGGGILVYGKNNGGMITGVESPVIIFSAGEKTVYHRDLNGEYTVRPFSVVIDGSGFRHGGGTVQQKDGPVRVSRYALCFDDAPFPLSDLQVADKRGTRLAGIVRVPVELLVGGKIDKPRTFRVYDRIEGEFVQTISDNAATLRFVMASSPTSAVKNQRPEGNPPVERKPERLIP